MTHLKVVLVVLVSLAVIVLVVQNHQAMSTAVQFRVNPVFFPEVTSGGVTLYQVAIITFLLGILITGIYGMIERFRLKRQIKTLTKELQIKDQELNSLRNLPITSDDVSATEMDRI
jgi:putative membrane protein